MLLTMGRQKNQQHRFCMKFRKARQESICVKKLQNIWTSYHISKILRGRPGKLPGAYTFLSTPNLKLRNVVFVYPNQIRCTSIPTLGARGSLSFHSTLQLCQVFSFSLTILFVDHYVAFERNTYLQGALPPKSRFLHGFAPSPTESVTWRIM